jgi:Peptidase family M28/PDZ domain
MRRTLLLSVPRVLSISLAIALCMRGGPTIRAGENLSARSAAASITTDDLRRHAEVLANDTFEGREAGSRGGHAAAGYLIGQLKREGLRGAGTRGGYAQVFGADYRNLLSMLEGSDPKLKDDFILVGAHYDHVGYGNPRNSYGPIGYIHNGADDNASGVATLLELAEAIAQLDPRPKRSVLFALWDGEEKGLLGSKHWLSQPTVPLSKVRVMINMDMVGRLRNNRLEVYGTRTLRGLRRLVSLQNETPQLLLDFTWEMKDNSDHYPFFAQGIPVVMLHTGLHADYHRPSDDVDKLQIEGMRRVALLLFGVVRDLGDEATLNGFREASRRESPYTQTTLEAPVPPLPSRLGVSWNPRDVAAPGLRVTRVVASSAAEAAGLREGDRIVRFAGHELSPKLDFTALVLAAASPVATTVSRAGEKEPLQLSIKLAGQPVEYGIAWREDDAEQGSVKLVRVVPGSPAARAGLQVLDRVYEVNGQGFADGQEFLARLETKTRPLPMVIERRGQLLRVSIEAPPEAE